CVTMASVNVIDPPPWDVSISSTDETCDNADGTATASPSGATSPYTYQWDANTGNQTNATATGLSAGSYSVTISDANNCDTVVTVTVGQSQSITSVQTSTTDASCSADDGSVTVTSVSGGTGPYQYSLDGSTYQSSNAFNNLAAGSYTVYVKDNNGCTATATAVVNQPDQPVPAAAVKNKDCSSAGSITATASGGTPPYTFSINGGTPQSDGSFNGLSPGSYTITVMDDNGCENTVPATVGDDCQQPPMKPATGFSPNGDGKNDVWSIANAQYYENCKITVFDRWGQKVFSQTGYDNKWDGRSLGYPVPAATYYYIIWLDKSDKSQGMLYGYVAVVR
ncbi:MAG: gliding motility-associated C-terminal domain-containing protein, partial [Flavobacteriales bacterium]